MVLAKYLPFGMTKTKLAEEMGISRPTLDAYLKDPSNMSLPVAKKFCDITGVDIDTLSKNIKPKNK